MTDAPQPRDELIWELEAVDRLASLVKEYPTTAQAVIPAIYDLATNAFPVGSTPLGGGGIRRLLLGYFRVLYEVTSDPPVVRVILVGRTNNPR